MIYVKNMFEIKQIGFYFHKNQLKGNVKITIYFMELELKKRM